MNSNQRCTVATAVTPTTAGFSNPQTSPPSDSDSANTAPKRFAFGANRPAADASTTTPAAHLLRDLLLVTFLGAVVLVPSQPQAATLVAASPSRAAAPAQKPPGLRALTESELAAVNGQGAALNAARRVPSAPPVASLISDNPVTQLLQGDAQAASPQAQSALKVLQDVGKLLHPQGKILQADITMNDVVYDTADRAAIVKPDGSVTFVLPKTIGHISVQDVRISGSTGAGFGNIDIRGIDLRGTRVSVRTY